MTIQTAKKEYENLLEEKQDLIDVLMPEQAKLISALDEKTMKINSELKEVNEALFAGENTYNQIVDARKMLESARSWGTYDMLGGGFLATMAKHDYMDKAKDIISRVQNSLRVFGRELADIDLEHDFELNISEELKFADYFFDNIFVDHAVQKKIEKSLDEVQNIEFKLSNLLNSIRKKKYNCINDLEKIRHEKEQALNKL